MNRLDCDLTARSTYSKTTIQSTHQIVTAHCTHEISPNVTSHSEFQVYISILKTVREELAMLR